nr:MAG TPA: hypothetical protein [Caudoviricetes sp.]
MRWGSACYNHILIRRKNRGLIPRFFYLFNYQLFNVITYCSTFRFGEIKKGDMVTCKYQFITIGNILSSK